ncbi:MAG: iron-sulfur protein, partial [Clostridia bacterium]|nr:iron-sulfur protein [Clostridia bacterium]
AEAPAAEKPGDVVILTDCRPEDAHLQSMIDRFRAVCPCKTRVINLREYPFKGGCLGCFNCASSGKCVYPDGFDEFLRTQIQTAEAEVHAFTISDHGMSSVFKCYSDRQFCNGHRTVRMGAPIGYIVSGNYRQEENLRMIIEGRAEVGGNFLCGVATDEVNTDAAIDQLAATLDWALAHHHTQPKNFLGVGGMRIFRDLIWLMQGLMREDHRFFKAHGQYDFPQKQRGRMLAMYLVGALMGNEKLRKKAGGKMTEGMLMPYTRVLEQTRRELAGKK